MKYLIVILSFVFCSASTFAAISTEPGDDDVENFFSQSEMDDALGANADEIRQTGALTPSTDDDQDANDDDADVTDSLGSTAPLSSLIQLARGGQGAPVWGPFISNFRRCAPGCVPANYNVYRRGRRTCHAQGRAIDVGAIICDGQTYPAIQGGRFNALVACMQSSMVVLYHEHRGRGKTKDHYDHAHFSIGCNI